MLFTQFNMEDALEANYEEGYEDGLQAGYETGAKRGELLKLIQLVCRKFAKGKTPDIIADELEENIEIIVKICTAVKECDGTIDVDMIYEKVSPI